MKHNVIPHNRCVMNILFLVAFRHESENAIKLKQNYKNKFDCIGHLHCTV